MRSRHPAAGQDLPASLLKSYLEGVKSVVCITTIVGKTPTSYLERYSRPIASNIKQPLIKTKRFCFYDPELLGISVSRVYQVVVVARDNG